MTWNCPSVREPTPVSTTPFLRSASLMRRRTHSSTSSPLCRLRKTIPASSDSQCFTATPLLSRVRPRRSWLDLAHDVLEVRRGRLPVHRLVRLLAQALVAPPAGLLVRDGDP